MSAIKNITFISLLGALIVGTLKKIGSQKKCFGVSIKRKNLWKMKQKQIAMLFKIIFKFFKAKKESKNVWKRMFQSA